MITTESIGIEEARQAIEAILAAVTPEDNPVAIAVTDAHGELIACLRQDGAAARMGRRSRAKAYSAAAQRMDTVVFRDRMKAEGRSLDDWGDPRLTSLQGGLAVVHDGRVVGGIAMSGNNTARDEQLAGIGRAAMKLDRATAAESAEKKSVGLEAARRAVEATLASVSSADRPIAVAVAVADENGELVHAARVGAASANGVKQTSKRRTFNLPGLAPAGAVAPDLVQVGNLFFTSAVRGVDLASGRLGATPKEQFSLAWQNLGKLVEGAGLSLDNVGLVTNFIDSQDYRAHINPGWLELWPSDDRPARKTTSYPLPQGEAVELQAFGVVGAKRQIIQVEGLAHRDPLPNGVRIGDYVFSSVIVPQDLATAKTVEGPEAQTDQCFDNMRVFMEQAGGSVGDVVLQWVYLSDFNYQSYMVDVYLKAWPIGGYQAARKTFRYPMNGQIQIQVIGGLGGQRSTHEIERHEHHDPIPLGARIGDLYASSGVSGIDPNGANHLEAVEGAASQAHFGLGNIQRLVEAGGGSLADIGHMTLLVQDYADLPAIDGMWKRMFPDPNDRPARQVMKLGAQGRSHVQYHMLAVV